MVLPLNYYTQWYWKTDLHNFMGFLKLRLDPHAQYVIRVYAEAMLSVLKRWTPLTYLAFLEHRMGAVTLSAKATAVLRAWLQGQEVTRQQSELSSREWMELIRIFDLQPSQKKSGP